MATESAEKPGRDQSNTLPMIDEPTVVISL